MSPTCFTIGHSNHTMEKFLGLLRRHNITLVIDVRSQPYSKYVPDFNKENISRTLSENEIEYAYLGKELGGRANDYTLMTEDGQTDYSKVMETADFKKGIKKVLQAVESGEYVALMCTEKDPLDCHRFVLVSRALSRERLDVRHILENGESVDNRSLEKRLLERYKLDSGQTTLFEPRKSRDAVIEEAYCRRGGEIAYRVEAK